MKVSTYKKCRDLLKSKETKWPPIGQKWAEDGIIYSIMVFIHFFELTIFKKYELSHKSHYFGGVDIFFF